jgi:hypothetical protein
MLYPINFSIPSEKICEDYIEKTKILSNIIPGDLSTYIYNSEEEYYEEYKKSYFAITKKKAGWDCMRHYEILANGCIPVFIDIEKCPKKTMTMLPKELLIEGKNLYNNLKNKTVLNEEEKKEYNKLRMKLLEHTKKKLTTDKIASYIIKQTNKENISNILYLSGDINPDYLRCLTLHGFKLLFGSNCHDYPRVPHIYKSTKINYTKLYGKGITYTNLLEQTLHNDNLDKSIIEDIKNKRYDLIIYGSYHRGMPYYDVISTIYNPNEVILICGEDLHNCNYKIFLEKGHNVFVREL